MNKKKNTPKNLNDATRKTNHRSPQESKLERRRFALPMAEQEKILQEYRDKGLAFGRASHTGLIKDKQQTQTKENNMEKKHINPENIEITFLNRGESWESGKTVEHVVATVPPDIFQLPIGRIDTFINEESKERSYRGYDAKGDLTPAPNHYLISTKRYFLNHKEELLTIALENPKELNLGGAYPKNPNQPAPGTDAIPSPYVKKNVRNKAADRISKSLKQSKSKSRGR